MEPCELNDFFSPAQRERFLAAVNQRRSVRAYRKGPDLEQLGALNFAAARVCLPGVRIVLAECGESLFVRVPVFGGISGAKRCACIFVKKQQPHAMTLAGISGEAFVLEAQSMNVATCWVSGTYRRKLVPVEPEEDEKLAALIALGTAAPESPGTKRRRKALADICLSPPADWPHWAYQAAEAVRQAPSAVNLQPWRLNYSHEVLRLLCKRPDSLDAGIAMLHAEAAVSPQDRHWEWGEGNCTAHLLVTEKKQAADLLPASGFIFAS